MELHDHLGGRPAIWVGHDLGSPVIGTLAAHHPELCRGVALISVPYSPESFALSSLAPLVDRELYPVNRFPDGQWDYYRFYLTHFDQAVADFNADISATLSAIYRRGNPASAGKVYSSATVTARGGWFGPSHRAPTVTPDTELWSSADFDALIAAFRLTGFRPGHSWYLNDAANIAYARGARRRKLHQPVLFVNGEWDAICDVTRSRLGEPMRRACRNLTVTSLPAGHWLPLERKNELVHTIRSWVQLKGL